MREKKVADRKARWCVSFILSQMFAL